MMITTSKQYRQALLQTETIDTRKFPHLSFPHNTRGRLEVLSSQQALGNIQNSRAGFIGRGTATLVHKIL